MGKRRYSHSSNRGFDCGDSVLLLPFGRESYLPAIVAAYDGVPVPLSEATDRIVYHLRAAPDAVTLVYSGMGGPATANALEMVARNGGRRVVVFGACGGVHPTVAVGHLIAATGAVRGEGTSDYYAPPSYPATFDPELCLQLERQAARQGVRVHRGVVYTTDASYRQGAGIYDTYRDLIVAVECECSAAAVVGAQLGLTLGALLFCTDNVTSPNEDDQAYRGLQAPPVRAGFEAGLEASMAVLSAAIADRPDDSAMTDQARERERPKLR